MKIYWTIILFSSILFFTISCDIDSEKEDSDIVAVVLPPKVIGINLDSILKRGKLIAITNNSPTSYFIYKGRPMGYQYDILKEFTNKLGVDLEIKIVASIPDAIDSLKNKKADILASGLTVLKDRKEQIDFSIPITQTRQVLIQRKPEGYRKMSKSKLEKHLLRNVTQLAGKDVYVEEGSSYYDRLLTLQNEIGDTIHIRTYAGEIEIDSILKRVSIGEIDYAITEEYTAKFFVRFYPDLDINTPISFNQNIAWAVPKNSTKLLDTINSWIEDHHNTTRWAVIYNKYFKHNKNMNTRANSSFNMENGKISPYDELVKKYASTIGWDWRLISAQINVESGFNPNQKSWVGAQGLMQIMPSTAKQLSPSHSNVYSPSENIKMGVKLNGILYDFWIKTIKDSTQAIKFSLASYNIGKGHVFDAQRLATKYKLDPLVWDNNVELMMNKLSKSNYYRDPLVRHGYCRGFDAYNYVNRIFNLYTNYQNFNVPGS